jgi:hypothetical protein
MIFHPAILALLIGSVLISSMLLYSAYYGTHILRSWDIRSGSEGQLNLERRTYLISTLMSYAFGFQLLSLFLFIYTADRLSPLFVGAMCAAGSLNANEWGYPTIGLKIFNFLLPGLWLVVNYTDNRAYDYPLIKTKYALLILITPLVLAETILQGSYFLSLQPNIITSCCGTLFTADAEGVTSGIIALPYGPVEALFYSSMALSFSTGIFFYFKGKGSLLFSLASIVTFAASTAALISFISLYIYELPTHHCPFCILQKEYSYVGYSLYVAFLGGAVSGMGVGVLTPFRRVGSLKDVLPVVQKKLAAASLIFYGTGLVIVLYWVIFSNLSLRGY